MEVFWFDEQQKTEIYLKGVSEVRLGGGIDMLQYTPPRFPSGLVKSTLEIEIEIFGLYTKKGIDDAQRRWMHGKTVQRQRKKQLIASLSVHWTTDPQLPVLYNPLVT